MAVHVIVVELDEENRVFQTKTGREKLYQVKQVVANDQQDNE